MDQRVFIIDEGASSRESLSRILGAEGLPIEASDSPRAFLEQFTQDQDGCILADVRMAGMDGLAFVEELNRIGCALPIIAFAQDADVDLAVQFMKAGVADFFERPFSKDHVVKAVRGALDASHGRAAYAAQRAAIKRRRASLTEREVQVLDLVVGGLSSREIADRFGISFRTVQVHRARIMYKMKAESLSDLVKMTLIDGGARVAEGMLPS